jgi:hypothetical protein
MLITKIDSSRARARTYARRTVVTAVAGGISFAMTNLVTDDQLLQLALSITVGGIVLLLQLLIDVEDRLTAVDAGFRTLSDDVEITVKDAIAEVGDVTALLVQAEDCGIPPVLVREVVRAVVGVGSDVPLLAKAVLLDEASRLRDVAVGLKKGVVERDGEDRDRLLALTRTAARTIDAISLQVVDGREFWSSGLGNNYLAVQREAVARDVRIRRVFVFYRLPADGPFELPGEVFERHRAHGIDVRVLLPDEIPDPFRNDLRDVIVFDGEVSYETVSANHTGDHGGEIRSNKIEIKQADVTKRCDHFEQLWSAATPHPVEAGADLSRADPAPVDSVGGGSVIPANTAPAPEPATPRELNR